MKATDGYIKVAQIASPVHPMSPLRRLVLLALAGFGMVCINTILTSNVVLAGCEPSLTFSLYSLIISVMICVPWWLPASPICMDSSSHAIFRHICAIVLLIYVCVIGVVLVSRALKYVDAIRFLITSFQADFVISITACLFGVAILYVPKFNSGAD